MGCICSSSKDEDVGTSNTRTNDQASSSSRGMHSQARSADFPFYPARSPVRDDQVPWEVAWPEYAPTDYTGDIVLTNNRDTLPGGWADPPNPEDITAAEWATRISYEGAIVFTESVPRVPINPRGRTGMCSRGYLGKWGPNHAADPIVTRFEPSTSQLQVVAIVRRDTGAYALPGGMVDHGELVSATVRREFMEEAGNVPGVADRAALEAKLDTLFAGAEGKVVYRGYVDDPRNTDNAWMETTAFHFHCPPEIGNNLPLHAGDDAEAVTWLDVDLANPKFAALYASHKDFVLKAVERI